MDLNPQQQKAVAATGTVAIIAGPGSGKTKTLATRIQHLIAGGVPPTKILALTFTKKSAQEMRQRVGNTSVHILTFHALCHQLLGADFTFVSEPERLAIIKRLSKPAELKDVSTRDWALRISRAKNGADESLGHVVHEYNAALAAKNLIDFDDLLVKARDMLRDSPDIWPDFSYIMVDEFQDTNNLQYDILQLLRRNDQLFVIGDPNQSIYGFRGASGTIFDTFKADFPKTTSITLGTNYRSSPQIVRVSNAIFGDHQHASQKTAGLAQAVKVLNEYSEAHFVLNEIQKSIGGADLLKAKSADDRRDFSDFAVIYRSRFAARHVQKALADSGLPYQMVGEGSPYEQPHVEQLISLLRIVIGQPADVKGFTKAQIKVLAAKIKIHAPPAELATNLVKTFAIQASPEIDQFIGTLVRFKTVIQAVDNIDAIAGQNFYDPNAQAITLTTIHAAKGLEFSCVFVVGAEEGILPHNKADASEEKRLFYVAATRAKEQLCILHAKYRGSKPAKTSRFITDIPDDILPRIVDPALQGDQRKAKKRATRRAQTTLF